MTEPDALRAFADSLLAPLDAYDRDHRGELLTSLQAFLAAQRPMGDGRRRTLRASPHAPLPDAQGRGAHRARPVELLRPDGVLAGPASSRPPVCRRRGPRDKMGSGSMPTGAAGRCVRHFCCWQISLFGVTTKIFQGAADAFRARRYEGPHRFTQKRPRSFVSALRSIAVRPSRPRCSLARTSQLRCLWAR